MSDNHTDDTTGKLVVGTQLSLDGVMQAPGDLTRTETVASTRVGGR